RPPEPLVEGLTGLRIRYRGQGDEGLTDWLDEWDAYEQLPLQVSIEIESEDGGIWPPLVVALPQAGTVPGLGSGRSRLAPAARARLRGAVGSGDSRGTAGDGRGSGRSRLREPEV